MFQTVHGSLFYALGIQAGEHLLIRGGTSSIGLLAIQIARKQGLTVFATTRNPAKESALLEAGASQVWIEDGNLIKQAREKGHPGFDKVLELVGTSTLQDSLACARPGGTVCMTGMLSESWSLSDFSPMEFIPSTVKLTTYDSGSTRSPADAFHLFIDDLEKGSIQLKTGRTFQLKEIVDAHQLMESNLANGKIVVVVP